MGLVGEHTEIAAYRESIAERLDLIGASVRNLTPEQLNVPPTFERANSVWVLATHAIGNARAWILGIACGRDMKRDRPAEFASSGDDAARLVESVARTRKEVDAALHDLDPARLDVRFVPPQDLWGEGPPHEISVRDAIIQVIEHASLHLGHIDIVRSLALQQR
jgi:hypothetical protein